MAVNEIQGLAPQPPRNPPDPDGFPGEFYQALKEETLFFT